MATQTLFKNQPFTTATSTTGTTTSDTAWTVVATGGFPSANSGSTPATVFHICDPANPVEIITVTSTNSGTSWTVTRGAESSTAVAHAAGATYYQVVTAADMANMIQAAGVGQTINPGTLGISDGASAGAVLTVTNTTTTPTAPTVQWFGLTAADALMGFGITGDTVFRLNIDTNGTHTWGPGGSTATDITLTRSGAGILTLNPGALTINGIITGNGGAAIAEGVTLTDQSTPATPTSGPILYGSSSGYAKYVGTDGAAYSMGKVLNYNVIGNQSITLATQTSFQCSNTGSGTMDFILVSGTYYKVRGNVNWATSGTTYQRWNFGNVAWTGDITLNTWDNNVSNSATLTCTIAANGIFPMPLLGSGGVGVNEGGNNWFTDINGFIKATASGTLSVQGGCSPGPGASWTFNSNSWFSFEPIP